MRIIDTICRCGHPNDSTDPHHCHTKAYTCKKPAKQRFYNPRPPGSFACLAGVQMKLEMSETWACDECWEDFKIMMAAHNKK